MTTGALTAEATSRWLAQPPPPNLPQLFRALPKTQAPPSRSITHKHTISKHVYICPLFRPPKRRLLLFLGFGSVEFHGFGSVEFLGFGSVEFLGLESVEYPPFPPPFSLDRSLTDLLLDGLDRIVARQQRLRVVSAKNGEVLHDDLRRLRLTRSRLPAHLKYIIRSMR